MERLEKEEAEQLLSDFRAQRLIKDFCFQFQLEHKPRRGKTVRYDGILFGSWDNRVQAPISRFKLFPKPVGNESPIALSPIELIVKNGPEATVWLRDQSSEEFTLIEDNSLFEPVFKGVLFTPFDLQMPFIFWERYDYDGPSRILSRIGQRFLMYPPEDSVAGKSGVSAVCVAVDDTYYGLLRAEVFKGKRVHSRFTARGFKKVQGHYIVKEIELKHFPSKDATNFKVEAAHIGLAFARNLFDPENPGVTPQIPSSSFEAL